MALVTYILLAGIVAGLQSRFHPSLLGAAASKSLGIVFIEFLVIKLGCYLLNIGGEGTVTDLLAYSGYKFVGIITCLVAALFQLRGWAYALVFVYVFCANALFLVRRPIRSTLIPVSCDRYATSSCPIRPCPARTARRRPQTRPRTRRSGRGRGSCSASPRVSSCPCTSSPGARRRCIDVQRPFPPSLCTSLRLRQCGEKFGARARRTSCSLETAQVASESVCEQLKPAHTASSASHSTTLRHRASALAQHAEGPSLVQLSPGKALTAAE